MCSLMPSEKLPRPSKLFGLRPRKSRTRGSAILISRSRNSYMRALRNVTLQPIAWPVRSLQVAIDLRALVTIAFWPAIRPRSAAAPSTFLRSATPSPMPILMTTLSSTGTSKRFLKPNCSASLLRIASSNCTFRRAGTRGSASRGFWSAFSALPAAAAALFCLAALSCLAAFFSALAAVSGSSGRCLSGFFACLSSVSAIDLDSRALGDAHLLAVVVFADIFEADPGRLAVLGVRQRDVRQVDRRFLGNDAALLRGALLLVALDHVDAAHQRTAVGAAHLDDLAGAALVAARDHDHRVALFDLRRHYSTSGASEMIFM